MISILEAVNASMTRRTREVKIKAAAGNEALKIAKEKGSPLYSKYKKFNKKRLLLKKQIMEKYLKLGERKAREKMRKKKPTTVKKKSKSKKGK